MIIIRSNLSNKILNDKYNALIFGQGRGRKLFLVGGFVRDALRGMVSNDRDFIVSGDLRSFVKKIDTLFNGSIVQFKTDETVRIVHREGTTFDFSKLQGSLEEDLSKRDFTINSIAWSPEKGLIDLFNGIDDLRNAKIKSLSRNNIINDPLRMLRAYRFASEIEGSIDEDTRKFITSLYKKINLVSSERITLEFFHLLNSRNSSKYLKLALKDNILTDILSLSYSMLERNVRAVSHLEKALCKPLPLTIKVLLKNKFSQNLMYKGLLCLEILTKNNENVLERLKISNVIKKRISLSSNGFSLLCKRKKDFPESLFDIFLNAKDAVPDILLICNRLDLLRDYQRFQAIWRAGLLNTEEIIDISGISHGPEIGDTIRRLKRAEFERRIRSRKQAVHFLKDLSVK
jgi:tRNA nucleotidyltransferase/poly(A) polymerase